MFSKEEASKLKQEFWRGFGQYLSLHPSAEGEKINWINYKTGIRYISFRMDADRNSACIWIELNHPDVMMQQLMYEQLQQLRPFLERATDEIWQWLDAQTDEWGKTISMVRICKPGVSIFKREDWSEITSFLKPRMLALDAFWSEAQYAFEDFR